MGFDGKDGAAGALKDTFLGGMATQQAMDLCRWKGCPLKVQQERGKRGRRWWSEGKKRDEAYSRAFAEYDTCDNSSCVRGANEPASWTITVEQFDEGLLLLFFFFSHKI